MDFIEARIFSKKRPKLMTDSELRELMVYLTESPNKGDSIKGTGGFRKIRWVNSQRNKGKRSGSRTIYMHIVSADTIYLMMIYDHEEKDDLSSRDRKAMALLARELKYLAKKACKEKGDE